MPLYDFYADEVTRRVIGAPELLSHVTPDSEPARNAWRAPRHYGPSEHQAHREAQIADMLVESWWERCELADQQRVRRALAQLPLEVERVFRRLQIAEQLSETELFVLKRLLYQCHVLLPLASDALAIDLDVAACTAHLNALLQRIHPEEEPSPRFHLSETLDADLARARDAHAAARRQFMARRAELIKLVQPDYPGARIDLDGQLQLAGAQALQAANDARLRPHGARWQLRDEALDAARGQLAQAEEAVLSQEAQVLEALSQYLHREHDWLVTLEGAITDLDLRLTRARLKRAINGCWPAPVDDKEVIELHHGAPPAHEAAQPVDFMITRRAAIVTGPNMGGKSSLLRLLGLCQWCMQRGLPAPAASYSGPLLAHLIYIGSDEILSGSAAQEASAGLSSFGREIRRLVLALEAHREGRALWLLDEVGRGTHPEDGAALAGEIVERLMARQDFVVFATHFPDLARGEQVERWQIAGLREREGLEALACQASEAHHPLELETLEGALRQAMDYRPMRLPPGDATVPRDARLIARLLGW